MKVIVTRQNPDGTFDNVGMNNRFVTASYQSIASLLRYGIPSHWQAVGYRVQDFDSDAVLYSTATQIKGVKHNEYL